MDKHLKVIKVINSCETISQLRTAEKYVRLFKKTFIVSEEINILLERTLLSKKMKIKNGWDNKN